MKLLEYLSKIIIRHNSFGFGVYLYHKGLLESDGEYIHKFALVIQFSFWYFEFIFKIR